MTKYYEVIFETGTHSVMSGESDEEVVAALQNHQARAEAGELGGPAGQPAERIKEVLVYDKHPADYKSDDTLSADVALEEVKALIEQLKDAKGVVNVAQLSSAIRTINDPLDSDAMALSRLNSMYKMKETGKLDITKGAGK